MSLGGIFTEITGSREVFYWSCCLVIIAEAGWLQVRRDNYIIQQPGEVTILG